MDKCFRGKTDCFDWNSYFHASSVTIDNNGDLSFTFAPAQRIKSYC